MYPRAPRSRITLTATAVLAAACLLAFATDSAYAQDDAAGRVKVASGSVVIVRGSQTIPAHVGTMVLEADTLRTGADGRVGLTLKDDTRLSLGPSSEVRISRFSYSPAEGRLSFVMSVVRGIATYVSGQIARLAPDAVRLETPAAIVGIRGTRLAIRVNAE